MSDPVNLEIAPLSDGHFHLTFHATQVLQLIILWGATAISPTET